MLNFSNMQKCLNVCMLYLTKTRFYRLLNVVMSKLSNCFLPINLRAITKINMRSKKRFSFEKVPKMGTRIICTLASRL